MVPSSGSFRPVPLGQEYAICILFCNEASGKFIELLEMLKKKKGYLGGDGTTKELFGLELLFLN